jgi:hypothetical protein
MQCVARFSHTDAIVIARAALAADLLVAAGLVGRMSEPRDILRS